MKNYFLLILFLINFSCEKSKIDMKETFIIKSATTENELIEIEKGMASTLLNFYQNSDKKFEFYEALVPNKYLLNFNPNKKTLSFSTDICSGWSNQYKNVSLEKLNELANSQLQFNKYDSLLEKQTEKWGFKGDVPTNGCMGY